MTQRKLTETESERLIVEHTPLVKAMAKSLLRRLPASVELDDLMQDGFVGLLGAILQNTRDKAGGQFQKYVSQRVRGAMLDGLRQLDPGTRGVRQAMRRVELAIHALGHQLGRPPTESEVAAALAMPLADYQSLLEQAHGYTLFSLDDFVEETAPEHFLDWCATTGSDPVAALERRVLQRKLLIAISDLSVREEEVMAMLYVEALTMREAGKRLGVTEGRISQIHAHAIATLRSTVIGNTAEPSILKPRQRLAPNSEG
jgi:RNA polymerase sigma factor FliA